MEHYLVELHTAVLTLNEDALTRCLTSIYNETRLRHPDKREIVNFPLTGASALEIAPLAFVLSEYTESLPETVEVFLKLGANPDARDERNRPLLQIALREWGDPHTIRVILAAGPKVDEPGRMWRIDGKEGPRAVDYLGLALEVERLERDLNLPDEVSHEMSELLRYRGNLHHAWLYLRSWEEATLVSPEMRARNLQSTRFIELTRAALFEYPPGMLDKLLLGIEHLMDHHSAVRGWHPNEAELAVLLNHPHLDYKKREHRKSVNSICKAITSPYRLIEEGVETLSGHQLDTIRQLGVATYSFRYLRFEAEAQIDIDSSGRLHRILRSSLLEQFGFERVHRPSDTPHEIAGRMHPGYGAGFIIRPHAREWHEGPLASLQVDPETYFEFRRTYTAIFDRAGGLMVRNSSPDGGRSVLTHFAYWRREGFGGDITEDDVLTLSPRLFSSANMSPVLHLESVQHGLLESDAIHRKVGTILKIKDAIRRWEFDTDEKTAWERDPETGRLVPNGIGLHLSEGFPAVVDFLSQRFHVVSRLRQMGAAAPLMPTLAFHNPDFQPWAPEPFPIPEPVNGRSSLQTRLTVTGEVLALLQKLAAAELRSSDLEAMERSGLESFLKMGARTQSQLILLPPKSYDDIQER